MKTLGSVFKQGCMRGAFARSVSGRNAEEAQVVVVVFALCSLFMMMSFGMTFPTFAHLFKENSSGIIFLSIMALAPQMASLTLSLLLTQYFPILLLASLLSGIGSGLVLPLLGTCYLASVKAAHQSRISGIKEAVGALGGIVGSLPAILASHWLTPHSAFVIGGCVIVGGSLFAMGLLKAYHVSPVAPMIPASGLPLSIPRSAETEQLVAE